MNGMFYLMNGNDGQELILREGGSFAPKFNLLQPNLLFAPFRVGLYSKYTAIKN